MKLETRVNNTLVVIIVASARIDAAAALDFKDSVIAQDIGGARRVVLDLSAVTFMDSSGLGAVVSLMKHFAPGVRLELAGLTPLVAKVFRLTRMDQVFVIHDEAPRGAAA